MVATITIAVLAQEAVLVGLPHVGVQARVIGQGPDALLAQGLGDLLDALARLAVDDAGVAFVLALDEAQQLGRRVLLLDDRVADVGPVEAADELSRLFQLQPLDDVLAGDGVGRGRQRDAGHDG